MICENPSLLQRWRKQVGLRRRYPHCRSLAAMGFLVNPAASHQALIDIRHLTVVVLHDEAIGNRTPALRLVGYGVSQTIDGVQWGGLENSKFYKDLQIEPDYGGSGLQLNLHEEPLLELSLRLKNHLYRIDRFQSHSATVEPEFPRLWAAFAPTDDEQITGSGPELTTICKRFGMSPEAMLAKFRRQHDKLICYPLDWVGEHLIKSVAAFAEIGTVPNKQAFQLTTFPESLIGYQGAAAFDFYRSALREFFESRLKLRRGKHRSCANDIVLALN